MRVDETAQQPTPPPPPSPPASPPPPPGDKPAAPTGDFLAWSMGNGTLTQNVVVLPVIAGSVLAIIATLFKFGDQIPMLMGGIPWDLLKGYTCSVLPRNAIHCCFLLAPLASLLLLLTRPRLRAPAGSAVVGPAIALPYWVIAFVGMLLAFIVLVAFDIFGGGWAFACRIQERYGIGGRFVLTALLVLTSPAVSIAALVIGYHFRRWLVVSGATMVAEAAMRKIGRAMVLVGLIVIAYAASNLRGGSDPTAFDGVWLIATGFLVSKGSLGTARLTGWLNAGTLAIAAGAVLSAPLYLPFALLEAKLHTEPVVTLFRGVAFFANFTFALWVFQAVRSPSILAARKAAGRSTAMPWTGFGVGIILSAYGIVGVFETQYSDFAQEARRQASAKYGTQYEYMFQRLEGTSGGHVYVSLIGYKPDAIIKADVDFEPKSAY
jgi:hypothetical protein